MTDRSELIAQLRAEGLTVTEWTDPPGVVYDAHTHAYREVRVVLTGQITFVVGDREIRLGPGDRIEFAADEAHAARVGADGVTYLAGTAR